MERKDSESGLVIDIRSSGTMPGSIKTCGEAPCGFSDAKSISKDAKERSMSMKKLLIAVILCVIFMAVEIFGGIKANSLAILTDAAHLLSDVASFAISLFSLWASGWEANPRQSYGFFRIEILGALVSIQLIWLLTGIIVYEAIVRLIYSTGEVQGFLMFLVAAFGLVVNIVMAVLLGHDHGHSHSHDHGHSHSHGNDHNHSHNRSHNHVHDHENEGKFHQHHSQNFDQAGPLNANTGVSLSTDVHNHKHDEIHDHHHHHNHQIDNLAEPLLNADSTTQKKQLNINVQGAYLHVLGDSIQSVGVMIGGGIIWYKPEWKIIDLICTLIFSVIVLSTTIRMLRSILEVLMESTPREIDATRVGDGLCGIDEVVAIHELHIWAITVGKVLLACHVKIREDADADMVLNKVVEYIRTEYNITHVTIQIERD